MLKKYIPFVILIFVFTNLVKAQNLAALDSLKGFKEFAFEANKSTFSNYLLAPFTDEDLNSEAFIINSYKDSLGKFAVSQIELYFIENKLLKVVVNITGTKSQVQDFLKTTFGSPTSYSIEHQNLYKIPYATWRGKLNVIQHYYYSTNIPNYSVTHQIILSVSNYNELLDAASKKQATSAYSDFTKPSTSAIAKDTVEAIEINYIYQTEIKGIKFESSKKYHIYTFQSQNKNVGYEGLSYLEIALGKNELRGYLILTFIPSKIIQSEQFPYGQITIFTNNGNKINCTERNLNSSQIINNYREGTSVYFLTFSELEKIILEGINTIYFGLSVAQNEIYSEKYSLTDLNFYFR